MNLPPYPLRRTRESGYTAVRRGPFRRRVEEALDLGDLLGAEVVALLHHRKHVPPRRQVVEPDAELREGLLRLGKDVVVEVDEHVLDDGAGVAQRLTEVDLRAPVGGERSEERRVGKEC